MDSGLNELSIESKNTQNGVPYLVPYLFLFFYHLRIYYSFTYLLFTIHYLLFIYVFIYVFTIYSRENTAKSRDFGIHALLALRRVTLTLGPKNSDR